MESSINFLKNKTIASIHVVSMLLMLMVIVVFSAMVIYKEYQDFEVEAQNLHAEFIQKQKDTIVFDTTRVLNFIKDAYASRDREQDEETVKKQILHAIEELYGRRYRIYFCL